MTEITLPPEYSMQVSNHPVKEEDFKSSKSLGEFVDYYIRHKHLFVAPIDLDEEAPIISELKNMSPSEIALRMETDSDFRKNLQKHRNSLS